MPRSFLVVKSKISHAHNLKKVKHGIERTAFDPSHDVLVPVPVIAKPEPLKPSTDQSYWQHHQHSIMYFPPSPPLAFTAPSVPSPPLTRLPHEENLDYYHHYGTVLDSHPASYPKPMSLVTPGTASTGPIEQRLPATQTLIGQHQQPKKAGKEGTGKRRKNAKGDRGESTKYECNDCNKVYSTHGGYTKHKQSHICDTQNKKIFNCKYCNKEYMSLGALKMHIRTHTLPCKCKFCGKAFSRPWLLQGHIRTHTGEKPFSCTHCSRAFADRSNLRAHLQTHSDVKKYNCRCCGKTFSRMSLLTKHEDAGCGAASPNNSDYGSE